MDEVKVLTEWVCWVGTFGIIETKTREKTETGSSGSTTMDIERLSSDGATNPTLGEWPVNGVLREAVAIRRILAITAENERLREQLKKADELADALTQPLPSRTAKKLKGSNEAWIDWYPPNSIVNCSLGSDTGQRIIGRIFATLAAYQAAKDVKG